MAFTIYTKPDCSFCDKAKEALKARDYEYEEINCYMNAQAIIELRGLMAPDKPLTVPQVFRNGMYIGGWTQLQNYLELEDTVNYFGDS